MSSPLPTAKVIHVDTRGAVILDEASPEVSMSHVCLSQLFTPLDKTRDSRGIYLPNYIEPVSHIAVDVRPFTDHLYNRLVHLLRTGRRLTR
jgi:type II pantothenate kinase